MKQMILVLVFMSPILSVTGEPSLITAKEFEVFAAQRAGEKVCMKGQFSKVFQAHVRLYDIEDKMIGFTMDDSKGEYFQYAMAKKSKLASELLSLKEDTPIRACGHIKMVPVPIAGSTDADPFFMVHEVAVLSEPSE